MRLNNRAAVECQSPVIAADALAGTESLTLALDCAILAINKV
jgi:hypothetical protein